jgi:Domain of unknown function (DUF4440)
MNRVAVVVTLLLGAGTAVRSQDALPPSRVMDVVWRDVYDSQGNRSRVPVFAQSPYDPITTSASTRVSFPEHSRLLAVDEEWRRAKLANDVEAMQRVLSDGFFETNQNGNSRDKVEALRLWSTFKIASLTPLRESIRVNGNMAIVSGEETEVNATGTDRLMFTRIYARTAGTTWQLLSSTQFRNPKLPTTALAAGR